APAARPGPPPPPPNEGTGLTLKTTSKTYREVGHKDLENFITTHYGRPYSATRGLDAQNGTLHAV
ncbi:hypothetical protein ACRWOO_29805, partial [Streptomyces sp. NEAU-PBA10]|uniref:hypothetical protein n=1 Tax=Streptomyces sp. NEAU-PBA10 TaxID=3438640 RepID=UPI003F7AF604